MVRTNWKKKYLGSQAMVEAYEITDAALKKQVRSLKRSLTTAKRAAEFIREGREIISKNCSTLTKLLKEKRERIAFLEKNLSEEHQNYQEACLDNSELDIEYDMQRDRYNKLLKEYDELDGAFELADSEDELKGRVLDTFCKMFDKLEEARDGRTMQQGSNTETESTRGESLKEVVSKDSASDVR